ncbi:unnamed protein product [Rotaria sordida]|uniref:Uncharacterized protein n=1 Tax=Rotaria sordida TaxID=392033 RepID=A0A815T5G8_9BILA|nr:unnamed protein product [Rotaria sordida]CAF1559584.1 unnamed protein product [Rotaria sordida]CAF4245341.1 unnamed protein product [Rotaria sordida]CAF4273110.1 unnamed protein product [Rotaria sordida]
MYSSAAIDETDCTTIAVNHTATGADCIGTTRDYSTTTTRTDCTETATNYTATGTCYETTTTNFTTTGTN